MKSFIRTTLRTVAVSGLLSATVLVPATAAQAAASGCSGRYDYNSYSAYCSKGYPAQFRAGARCYKIGTDSYVTRYGAWKTAGGGQNSVVTCLSSEEVASGFWQV